MADFNIDITTPAPFVIEFATVGPQGPAGTGGGGTITTANILYVDANGNDGTAAVDRLDLPYATPLAAQTAASTGDTIIVRPGSYSGAALGGKAGINWYWEPGSQYTNSTNNGRVWDFASGVFNVAGNGKFYQTTGNGGVGVYAISGRTGNFEADYVESVGGTLTFFDSCNVRVRHVRSSTYDTIIARPAVTTAVQDIEVGVADATGSNPVALEGTATTDVPIVIRIGQIIGAGDFLVIEESSATQKATIQIGDSVQPPGDPQDAIYSDSPSEVAVIFSNWRYSNVPRIVGAAANYKITVINRHVHAGEDITAGTIAPARLGSGTSITGKFLRGDSTWQTIAGGGDALTSGTLAQFAATTSAQLRGVISDETGSGLAVFNDAPNLIRPTFTASSTARSTLNLGVGVAPTSPSDGDLWTDSTGLFYRIATGSTLRVADKAIGLSQFGSTTSADLRAIISDETGTGFLYFQGGDIGTPSAGVVTNLTGTASININGTVGATTPAAGTFTTLVANAATSILVGTAGSTVGSVGFRNATSGTITVQPTTGALGTITITLPAFTGTAVVAATSTTTTQALFATATAGAPAFRAIAAGDIPTLNQSTTGSAATLTTTRTIGGSNFNGSANVTSFPAPGAIGGTTPSTGAFTTLTQGTLTYSASNFLQTMQSSVNAYNQLIIQNSSTGAAASANVIVNNSVSTDTTNFGEFGMNSSGFTGSGAFNQPSYVYLASTTVDLAIGTATVNAIHFVINSGATDAMTISSGEVISVKKAILSTETVYTPTGTTQTIPLNDGNHQTLTLASTTGNPTITLTVPSSSAAGTLILVQHGTTPRSITWTPSSGTILWAGGAPTFSGDAVNSTRVISWRWSSATSRLFFAATDVAV